MYLQSTRETVEYKEGEERRTEGKGEEGGVAAPDRVRMRTGAGLQGTEGVGRACDV